MLPSPTAASTPSTSMQSPRVAGVSACVHDRRLPVEFQSNQFISRIMNLPPSKRALTFSLEYMKASLNRRPDAEWECSSFCVDEVVQLHAPAAEVANRKLRHAIVYNEVMREISTFGMGAPERGVLETLACSLAKNIREGRFTESVSGHFTEASKVCAKHDSVLESLKRSQSLLDAFEWPGLSTWPSDKVHIAKAVVLATDALGEPDDSLADRARRAFLILPELATCTTLDDARGYVERLEARLDATPTAMDAQYRQLLEPTLTYLRGWFAAPGAEPERHLLCSVAAGI
jgi:hypothetical protein